MARFPNPDDELLSTTGSSSDEEIQQNNNSKDLLVSNEKRYREINIAGAADITVKIRPSRGRDKVKITTYDCSDGESNRGSSASESSRMSLEEKQSRIVNSGDLEVMAQTIGGSWKKLGRQLNLSEEQLNLWEYNFDNRDSYKRNITMLEAWHRQNQGRPISELINLLRCTGCHYSADEILKRREHRKGVYGVKITDVHIDICSEYIGNNWRKVGKILNIAEGKLDVIEHDHQHSLKEIIKVMLENWREGQFLDVLYIALRQAECFDAYKYLEKLM